MFKVCHHCNKNLIIDEKSITPIFIFIQFLYDFSINLYCYYQYITYVLIKYMSRGDFIYLYRATISISIFLIIQDILDRLPLYWSLTLEASSFRKCNFKNYFYNLDLIWNIHDTGSVIYYDITKQSKPCHMSGNTF